MTNRMRFILVLLLFGAMIALAACGGGQQPQDSAGEGGGGTDTDAEALECTDEVGCVEIAPGEPVVIGWALIQSGGYFQLGEDSRRGVEIAVEDGTIGYGGEILGHPIEVVGEDSQCTPEGGQAAATKLVTNEKILGIIGTNCSSAGTAAVPVIDDAKVVMISPSNTADVLTDPGERSPYYFRTAHRDAVQGVVAAEWAYNVLGARTAATIHDGSVYAEGLAKMFARTFEQLGGTVTNEEAVNTGQTDMKPVLTRIGANSPDIIYYPIFTTEAGLITRQAKEVAGLENTALMAADGAFSPDFLEAADRAAIGMYHSSPDLSALAAGYQQFRQIHSERFGEEPLSVFHAHAFDATMILLKAIEQVAQQGSDGTLLIGRKALRDAIEATTNYQGLTGTLTCNLTEPPKRFPGDCADPVIAVYQITEEAFTDWNPPVAPKKIYPEG